MRILPYIEQKSVYKHFDQKAGAYAEVNLPVRAQQLQFLACPSRSHPDPLEVNETSIFPSDYAGCHHHVEAPIDASNTGLLFLNSRIRFSDIEDGSSNTFLVGEKMPEANELGWVSGTRSTLRNTGTPLYAPEYVAGVMAQAEEVAAGPLDVGGFGSSHTGGAQFVFGDGSVRFLSSRTDPKLLQQFGHRSDGELMEPEERW